MKKNKIIIGVLIAGVVHLLLLIKLKFTAWPEMITWPFLLTEGWFPYRDIGIAHTPLLLTVLAFFNKLFGVGIVQLKIFTWLFVLLCDGLVYWVAAKLWNKKVAVYSLFAFVLLHIFYDGNGLWFDLGLVPFGLLLYYSIRTKNLFNAGIIFMLGMLTKQTFIWFALPILLAGLKAKEANFYKSIIAGGLLIAVPFLLIVVFLGLLPDLFNWVVKFGVLTLPNAAGQIQLPSLKNLAVAIFPMTILVALILNKKKDALSLAPWVIAGSLGAYPRFEYFHFQPALPFVAIAVGILLSEKVKNKIAKTLILPYVLVTSYFFATFFIRNYDEGTRFYDSSVKNVVNYIKSNTNTNDTIFVMNWWDSIYGLTGRLPATKPLIPQLAWYQELNGIQDEEISGLKNSAPKYIIMQNYTQSGLSSYIPSKVYEYVNSNYVVKEKVDSINILILK